MGNLTKDIFKRYSNEKATATEQKAVNLYFDSLQETSGLDHNLLTDETGDVLFGKIENRIARRNKKPYWPVAASVAAILLLTGIFYTVVMAPQQVAMQTIAAQLGQQQKVVLPDASVVYLNSGSSISYPVAFGKKSREVILKGEAYFEVEHKEKHPFIITSDHLKTQVLGTKFVVSNYAGDTPAVTVVSGKVKVTDKESDASQIITKGQRVIYNSKTAALIKSNTTNTEDYLAWKEGRIFFDHADMKQVLQTLHRRYNVVLKLNSALYECNTISGNFSGNNIEKVLNSIRFINGMEYDQAQNDTIKITLKPCKN